MPVFVGEYDVIEELTGFHLHRGALASMHRPVLPTVAAVVAGARRVLVLEDIVDHTNVGAAFRSGAALGIDAILVTPRCADPLYRRADPRLDGHRVPGAVDADRPVAGRDRGAARRRVHRRGAGPRGGRGDARRSSPPTRRSGSRSCWAPRATGWRRRTIAAADLTVRIPMAGGVDSLNVGGGRRRGDVGL